MKWPSIRKCETRPRNWRYDQTQVRAMMKYLLNEDELHAIREALQLAQGLCEHHEADKQLDENSIEVRAYLSVRKALRIIEK